MPVTVAVTGSTGFLGRRLLKSLLQEQELHVRCLVRESSNLERLHDELSPTDQRRVTFARGSLSNERFITSQFEQCDVVYHLAAALGGSCSNMFLNTVIPTRQLIQAAAKAQVGRFVLISSLGVYGTETVPNWGTLDESTPIDPHPELRDPYTFSKVRQEFVARTLSTELNLPLVVVRPGVIYGEGRSPLTSRVGLSLGPLTIRMGGGQILPYTYVENCAAGIKLAGLASGVDGDTFNLVDDDLPTGKEILRLLRTAGQKRRTLWIPRGAIGPLAMAYEWYSNWSAGQLPPVLTKYKCAAIWKPLRYSNAKAKHRLNWKPNISTEEGLRRTIAG